MIKETRNRNSQSMNQNQMTMTAHNLNSIEEALETIYIQRQTNKQNKKLKIE